ncbi:hypothetical protein Bbelb_344050 [Branchiostoma belcheri]|nr:hypothetical protein Bbelb_344050 [Branchiostoma belcheri]
MTSRVTWCPSLSPNIDSMCEAMFRNLTETQRRRTGWHSALFLTHYNHQRERVGGIPPDLNRRKIYRTLYAHNHESSIQNSPKCSLTVGNLHLELRNTCAGSETAAIFLQISLILAPQPERSPIPPVPDFHDNTPVYLQNSHQSTIVPPHDFLSLMALHGRNGHQSGTSKLRQRWGGRPSGATQNGGAEGGQLGIDVGTSSELLPQSSSADTVRQEAERKMRALRKIVDNSFSQPESDHEVARDGNTSIILRTSRSRPKVETIKIPAWSAANAKIMAKLIHSNKLATKIGTVSAEHLHSRFLRTRMAQPQ